MAKLFCSMTSLGPVKWPLTGLFTASIISYLPPSFSDFEQQSDVNALNQPLEMPLKPGRLTPNMGINTTYLCQAFSCSLAWAFKSWKTHGENSSMSYLETDSCGSQGILGRMKTTLAIGLLPLNYLTASFSSFLETCPVRQEPLMVPCGVL